MTSEFYPRENREGLCVEIIDSWTLDGWFETVLWKDSQGVSMQIPVPTIERARTVARRLYHLHAADFERAEAAVEIKRASQRKELNERADERSRQREEQHAARLSQITADTPRVEKVVCANCDHASDPDEWEQPVYECSRCGGQQVGEGENRCATDNVFMAKVGDRACPSCEAPDEGDSQTVTGVEIDGEFIPESEVSA